MIVREIDEPHRTATIAIVLQVFDVPWLRERGELTVRDDQVLLDGRAVAKIEARP
jgi:hypothetical protein